MSTTWDLSSNDLGTANNADLLSYMKDRGWQPSPPGPAGALWNKEGQNRSIAVPDDVEPGSDEWKGIIERLAIAERRDPSEVQFSVSTQRVDIAKFRAPSDVVHASTIDLRAGSIFIPSIYGMLRAVASCSFLPKGQIGGNFAARGEDVVRRARMAQTEPGSYIVPVLLPLSDPPETDQPELPGTEVRRGFEPPERRVSRTFAEALTAVEENLVKPERVPSNARINELVEVGGSREMLAHLNSVISQPSVTEVSARFNWAASTSEPSVGTRPITIPKEAAPIIEKAAQVLRQTKRAPAQIMTGPIVEIRHLPEDNFGSVSIDTVRGGRRCELRVRLPLRLIRAAYTWALEERTVVVEGVVSAPRSRGLVVPNPSRFGPLDEDFLEPLPRQQSSPGNARTVHNIAKDSSEPRKIENPKDEDSES